MGRQAKLFEQLESMEDELAAAINDELNRFAVKAERTEVYASLLFRAAFPGFGHIHTAEVDILLKLTKDIERLRAKLALPNDDGPLQVIATFREHISQAVNEAKGTRRENDVHCSFFLETARLMLAQKKDGRQPETAG